MNLILIRHAETEWNLEGRINGLTNIGITYKGVIQSKRTGEYLKSIYKNKKKYIYTSKLKRAMLTAEIINEFLNSELIVDNRLIERDYGIIEGQYINKIDWINLDDSVENTITILERVGLFINFIKEKHFENENIIIISHGSIIRHLIKLLCGVNSYIQLENCSISTIEVSGIDVFYNEESFNFIGHLN